MTKIITFREWNQNNVKVFYDLDGSSVTVTSFDQIIFRSNKKETINAFKNHQNKELLKVYKTCFQQIQKKFSELLDNISLV